MLGCRRVIIGRRTKSDGQNWKRRRLMLCYLINHEVRGPYRPTKTPTLDNNEWDIGNAQSWFYQ